jgi:hypothetical protein
MSEFTSVKRVEYAPGYSVSYKRVTALNPDFEETDSVTLIYKTPQNIFERADGQPETGKVIQYLTPEGGSVLEVTHGPVSQAIIAQLLLEGLPVAKRLEIFAREAQALGELVREKDPIGDLIKDVKSDLSVGYYARAIAKAGGNWEPKV